jgi:long-chain acyl-CoA synthetase
MGRQHVVGPEPVPVKPEEHLTSMLWRRADLSDEVARYHDGDDWVAVTWRELAERVRAVATGLVAGGIETGDTVAVMGSTSLDWTVADLAILAAGGVTVPIYETDSADQCAWVLSNAEVRLALAESREHAERLEAARADAPRLGDVLVFDDGALDDLAGHGGDAERSEVERRLDRLDGEAFASIVYTSGTTGRPKGCVLTHGNLLWTTRQATTAVERLFEDEDSSTLLFLPLAHIFTRVIQFGCLERGVIIGYARSLDQIREDIATFRPTFLLSVPRIFEKIYNNARKQATGAKRKIFDFADRTAEEVDSADDPGLATKAKAKVADALVYDKIREVLGGRVRYCVSGGAPLSDHLTHFFNAAGITVLQGYGLTETSSACTVDRPEQPRVGTVGKPLPGVEIKVADNGEVLVRGRNVFQGYHRNEDATREVLGNDGWYRTEDVGTLDDDGYLRITGRQKDIIVTAGGKNVAPEPIEEHMKEHRLISQPVLIGDDRPFVSALIALDEEELRSFAEEHGIVGEPAEVRQHDAVRAEVERVIEQANETVSKAESIREFRILDRELSLEKDELTPTMKPRRHRIAEHFAEDLNDIYA